MTSLINNRYLEITFDQQEITSFNFNDLKIDVNEKLVDEDSYDIVIFNMASVRYLDSTGISFFVNIRKKIGKEVILKNCSETVIKLFEILNLKDFFEFM
jgi:anti-anti-sigma factor